MAYVARAHTQRMESLGQQVLARVVAKLGVERTARELGVKPTLVERFLDGALLVPDALLIKLVDQVLDSAPTTESPPALLPDSPKPKGPIII